MCQNAQKITIKDNKIQKQWNAASHAGLKSQSFEEAFDNGQWVNMPDVMGKLIPQF